MKHKTAIILLTICFIVVLFSLFVVGYFYASSHRSIENALHLVTTVNQENFTELYFENHLNLPKQVTSSQEYFFNFTIHNLEGKNMQYSYEVYLELDTEKIMIDKNTVFIKNNDYMTVQEGFKTRGTPTKNKIVVYLINKNQKIDFQIEGIQKK
jgi:lipopolysaccharide export LptBFGC system permease protein LptF